MENAILMHRRSRARILATNVILMLFNVFTVGPVAYFSFIASAVPYFPWMVLAILFVLVAMGGRSIWKVWNQPNDFSCTLTTDRIVCYCPDETEGATFNLPLKKVRKIRLQLGDQNHRYYLVLADGREYHLTRSFGNPARRFVEEIRERFPHVKFMQS